MTNNNAQPKQWTIEDLDRLPHWPRRDAVSSFRLLLGLNCLGKHLHGTGIFAKFFALFLKLENPSLLVTTPNSSDFVVPENVLGKDFSNFLY
ncbi:hypothetical protein TNCV_115501 [Trichonephila clavipes]|nr:hypothetical protein TNCV_115501 [Trichonephila clavipes]